MPERGHEPLTVLLLSDPGLPSRRAASVQDRLEAQLARELARPVTLHTRTEMLRLRPDNTLDLEHIRTAASEEQPADLVLMLTEIPRHTEGRPLVAEVVPAEGLAVVSCPTLGAWATRRRIVRVLTAAALRLVGGVDGAQQAGPREAGRFDTRWSRWSRSDDDERAMLHAHTLTGGPRTVLGMILGNDPWRTAPKLSSALAAAAATGAFGIFYTSIWEMSSYLPALRLIMIGLLAVVSMVAWLILSNGLWDKPRRENLGTVVMLYNLSTVGTLLICVLGLYLALVVLILLGAVVVIDPRFMESVIQEPATFARYLDVAWLSAAMGVVAGALGSSFDANTDLRQITHGQRERQRRYTEEESEESSAGSPSTS